MSDKKIYCSYGHTGESNWLLPLGFKPTHELMEADVVLFGGGKDIDPGFYDEKKGSNTDAPSERDRREREDFETVQLRRKSGDDVKTVGVCRGHQLICALSGGKLIQDVGNHCGNHTISTYDKEKFEVNSLHHQMIFPYNLDKKDYKILAWSTKNISSHYTNGWGKNKWLPNGFKEIEIAYFSNTEALGYQMHPEMMYNRTSYAVVVKWMQELFMKFYKGEL